jgi:hypothetical protein
LAFELVDPEPKEGPTLVLRILDILTPINYPKQVKQSKYGKLEAGQLLQRCHKPETWTYPLADRPNGEAWLKFIEKTRRWK